MFETPPAPAYVRRKPAVGGPVRRFGQRVGGAVSRPWAVVVRLYGKVRTQAQPIEAVRLEAGVVACRPGSLAIALVVFLIGFSVDDLRVLRWPGYLVGAGLAFLIVLLGPLTRGRSFAMAWLKEPLPDFEARAGRARRLGLLRLLGAAIVFVGWLVVFSAGVPPWAR